MERLEELHDDREGEETCENPHLGWVSSLWWIIPIDSIEVPFCGFIVKTLQGNPKKELLWSLWGNKSRP